MLVACFSKHPLIDALREEYAVPVIGIMEAAMYSARILGGHRIRSQATGLGVLELEMKPRADVLKSVANAATLLVEKGRRLCTAGLCWDDRYGGGM